MLLVCTEKLYSAAAVVVCVTAALVLGFSTRCRVEMSLWCVTCDFRKVLWLFTSTHTGRQKRPRMQTWLCLGYLGLAALL